MKSNPVGPVSQVMGESRGRTRHCGSWNLLVIPLLDLAYLIVHITLDV